ncbi:MAG: hypothetical protein LQ338_002109 [Usnochroma carphineum]|nr:MAG: hypothetical protein LQ338_002109 [Usnochroma carphineum]
MFLSLLTAVGLGTVSFLQFAAPAFAGHSRFHRHQAAKRASPMIKRDAGPGMVEIPISDLQLLRTEMAAFQGWMHSWISTANASDSATNISQVKLEFQAYDGWMTAWLDSALSPSSSSPPPLPSSVPVTTSITSTTIRSQSAAAVVTSAAVQQADTTSLPEAALTATATTSPIKGGEFFQQSSSNSAAPTTLVPVFHASSTLSAASINSPPSSSSSSVTIMTSAATSPSTTPYTQPAAPANHLSSGSSTFNPESSSNLAVYYGQSGATSQVTLAHMCQDPNVDIVILAFLTTFFGAGGYPSLNLGAACGGPSTKMQAAGASGLLSCPTMENDIKTCQGLGKKVLLSLGGAEATTAFSSDSQASDFATKLWNLFGGGNGESNDMRPFGSAVIDGFDVDNEDHSTAFYTTFVSSLRSTMNADPSKKYYISAAPQCPRPDASIPLEAMQSMDFVFVQFYNNGDCNIGKPDFEASLKAWSQDLSAKANGPKLFIGAPGCSACAGSGYLGAEQMERVLNAAKGAGLSNFGGVMLWDGPEGQANVEGGKDYLSVIKGVMG